MSSYEIQHAIGGAIGLGIGWFIYGYARYLIARWSEARQRRRQQEFPR